MRCDNEACMAEIRELRKLMSDEEEEEDGEDSENDDFVHCESSNCHEKYLKSKNGAVCEDCYKNICEGCTMDDMATFVYDEDFFCPDCLKRRSNSGSIDYCQNRSKDCKTFVYINKNEAAYLCLKCNNSFCVDCQHSELVKDICNLCRQRKRTPVK